MSEKQASKMAEYYSKQDITSHNTISGVFCCTTYTFPDFINCATDKNHLKA